MAAFDFGKYIGRAATNLGRSVPFVEAFIPTDEQFKEWGWDVPQRARTPEEQKAIDYGNTLRKRGPDYYDAFAKDIYGERATDINAQAGGLAREQARRFSRAGLAGSGFSAQAQGQVGLNQQRALNSADIQSRQYGQNLMQSQQTLASMLLDPTINRDELFRAMQAAQEGEQRASGYKLGGDILALAMGLPPGIGLKAPIEGGQGNSLQELLGRAGRGFDNFAYGSTQVIY